ncbi:MAG: hypothetical protein HQL10_00645 [Nitrospirae bacterium]|nr:hypothetical protein [Nitrospirota bacterium]
MLQRGITIASIVVFTTSVVFLSFIYGPSKRTFVSPGKVELLTSPIDIYEFWHSTKVRGRVAVLFTRHLDSEIGLSEEPGEKYTELAMRHGIVRKIYHVVPDSVWPVVSDNLYRRKFARITSYGFVMALANGRIHVLPLSRFNPEDEKSLIVVEPSVWSSDELAKIVKLIKSGNLRTDIITIVRGFLSDAETFRSVLPPSM